LAGKLGRQYPSLNCGLIGLIGKSLRGEKEDVGKQKKHRNKHCGALYDRPLFWRN